jgi:hypothetical protein
MASSLLRRRLCIMTILAASLLFLPLTFTANNNNSASAQTPHCNIVEIYDVAWCIYERQVENQPWCIKVWTEHNEYLASFTPPLPPIDVSKRCVLPDPPPPLQPLDCNDLQTCPPPPCDPTRASCPEQSLPIEKLCPPSSVQSLSLQSSSPPSSQRGDEQSIIKKAKELVKDLKECEEKMERIIHRNLVTGALWDLLQYWRFLDEHKTFGPLQVIHDYLKQTGRIPF